MSKSRSRPSHRADIVASAARLARAGEAVSLDSAARAAGVTKPGLMYHFSTKQELMHAVVDFVIDEYERDLVDRIPGSVPSEASVETRLAAYVDWACEGIFAPGDLVMFTDPRLRESLTAHWNERMEPWVLIPPETPAPKRTRLTAARLMADGVWFESVSSPEDNHLRPGRHDDVRALAHALIKE